MRILFVQPLMETGGAERVILNQVYHLRERGYSTDILCARKMDELSLFPEKFHTIINEIKGGKLRKSDSYSQFIYLLKSLRKIESSYDKVIAHNIPAPYLAKFHKKRFYWYVHELADFLEIDGITNKIKSISDKFFISKVSEFAANSMVTKKAIKEQYGVNAFEIVPGVEIQKSGKEFDYAPLNNYDFRSSKTLLHVGRFDDIKNQDTIIKIFQQLVKKDKSFTVVLVGSGKNLEDIKKISRHKNIIFIEKLSESDLNLLYKSVDLTIFPSSSKQTLGLVPIESFVNGTFALVSDVCGVSHYLRRVDIPTPSIAEFQNNISNFFSRRKYYEGKMRSWKNYIKRTFNWKKHIELLEKWISR